MRVIVLAAGYATRLYPLTRRCAKPLLDVGGRPLLSHLVERVSVLSAVTEIVVVVNHRFLPQFQSWAEDFDGDTPLRLLDDGSTCDGDKLGATGDLAFALARCGDDDDLLVIGGDNLLLFDLRPMLESFLRYRQPQLAVRDLEVRDAEGEQQGRYNEVLLDAVGRVVRFREKPVDPEVAVAAICLYFYPQGIGAFVDRYLDGGGNPDAPGYFIEWLVAQREVRAERFSGPWFDIGSLETLGEARAELEGYRSKPE